MTAGSFYNHKALSVIGATHSRGAPRATHCILSSLRLLLASLLMGRGTQQKKNLRHSVTPMAAKCSTHWRTRCSRPRPEATMATAKNPLRTYSYQLVIAGGCFHLLLCLPQLDWPQTRPDLLARNRPTDSMPLGRHSETPRKRLRKCASWLFS